MEKWVIQKPTTETYEGDSGEPSTSAGGRLTSEVTKKKV